MFISLYGLALGAGLLVTAIVTRAFMAKIFARVDAEEAGTLEPDALEAKRRLRKLVMTVLNAEVIAMPIIGYVVGHFFLESR
jgi:hypothetical protein